MSNEELLKQLLDTNEDDGISLIYDYVLDLLDNKNYVQCNKLLESVSANKHSLLFALAFLSITVPYKNTLLSREKLLSDTKVYLRDNPEAEMLLYGL